MCVSDFVLGQADLSGSHISFQFAADKYEKNKLASLEVMGWDKLQVLVSPLL